MKKNTFLFVTASFVFLLFSFCVSAQRLSGVWAGLQTSLSVTPGGAMNRTDHVVYCRPDETYCANMRKPDWKTAVTGHYTLTGNKLVMTYVNGGKDFYTLKN